MRDYIIKDIAPSSLESKIIEKDKESQVKNKNNIE